VGIVRLFRRLAATPLFSLLFTAVLAVAIAATATVEAIVGSVIHRPLGVLDPALLVNIYGHPLTDGASSGEWQLSPDDYAALLAQQSTFEGLTAWRRQAMSFADSADPRSAIGEAVDVNYFDVLGVRPLMGRAFHADESPESLATTIVLSHDTWIRRFSGAADILGRSILVGSVRRRVIGIMPADFHGSDAPALITAAGWIPMASSSHAADANGVGRQVPSLWVKGRLRSGVTEGQAAADVAGIGRRLDASGPGHAIRHWSDRPLPRSFSVVLASDVLLHESMHALATQGLSVVEWALGLIMLIACTNLAALQLGRLASRRGEIAVRLALGASRRDVFGLLSSELLPLIAIAALTGVAIASGTCALMSRTFDLGGGMVLAVTPVVERRAWSCVALFSIVAVFLTGATPAWQMLRSRALTLNVGGATQVVSRWRVRRALIGIQVGTATILLVFSALFGARAMSTARADYGVDYLSLVAARIGIEQRPGFDRDDAAGGSPSPALMSEVLSATARVVGANRAALVSGLPLGFGLRVGTATPAGSANGAAAVHPAIMYATGPVGDALGLRLVAGELTPSTGVGSDALITEHLAQRLFGDTAAPGRRIAVTAGSDALPEVIDVTGVVADVSGGPAAARGSGLVIVRSPVPRDDQRILIARGTDAGDGAWLARTARSVSGRVAVLETRSGRSLLAAESALPTGGAQLTVVLAFVAMALSIAGLAGVMAHAVTSRTREIGLRMALGANRASVVRQVLWEGMKPVVAGVSVGGLIAAGAVTIVSAATTRLTPVDWPVYAGISFIILGAGFIACGGPAMRASAIQPSTALRQ
jgi:predicted permease